MEKTQSKIITHSIPKMDQSDIKKLKSECTKIIKDEDIEGLKNVLSKYHVHIGKDYLIRCACHKGKLKMVQMLVDAGADIFVNGNDSFNEAIKGGHYDVADYLVSKRVDINLGNGFFFKKAVTENNPDLLKQIIKLVTR